MPNVGPMELIIVLIVALIVFGPKKLPDLGRNLGKGMREFKASLANVGEDAESSPRQIPAAGGEQAEVTDGEVVGKS
jgi:sec-independent protein translocase protein TatA